MVTISEQPIFPGQDRVSLEEQVATDNQGNPTWDLVRIGGQVGYRALRPANPGEPQVIKIPLEKSILYILKHPFQSDLDPVFEEILKSIEIKT